MDKSLLVRNAQKIDCKAIWNLIYELAVYEKAEEQVEVTIQDLERDGFGNQPLFEVKVAEVEGKVVGMALYYFKYSTWKGKCLYLEDLVVKERFRKRGIGQQLFNAVVEEAKNEGVRRMEWQVLEWNKPAILFYQKNQATLDPEWYNCKLVQNQIETWKHD